MRQRKKTNTLRWQLKNTKGLKVKTRNLGKNVY